MGPPVAPTTTSTTSERRLEARKLQVWKKFKVAWTFVGSLAAAEAAKATGAAIAAGGAALTAFEALCVKSLPAGTKIKPGSMSADPPVLTDLMPSATTTDDDSTTA